MKVLFFRETSASNSSDDHRIVLLKSKSNCIEPEYLWHYNREDFFLASKKQKQRYLQVILGQAFHQLFKEVDMPTVVARYKKFYEENNFKEILGRAHVNKGNCAQTFDLVGEIGHQSSLPPVYDFCKTGIFYGEKYLCVEFYKEMFKDILRDNVAIEGGTDDCDERTEYNCVDYTKPYRMYYNWLRFAAIIVIMHVYMQERIPQVYRFLQARIMVCSCSGLMISLWNLYKFLIW